MTSTYKLIIFDWDGTVMDSVPRIVSSLQSTARAAGLAVPATSAIHDIIGLSLPIALEQLFDCRDANEQESLITLYRDFYVVKDTTPSPLFSGAETVFSDLQAMGLTLAVATGKARPGLERAWQETSTGHYFAASRCAKEVPSKPHPAMLEEILLETSTPAEQALMVGDSIHDLNMAQNAGIHSVGVTYGVHPAARLQSAGPRHLIDDIRHLPAWLQGRDPVLTQQAQ